jgi:hypothetical protein
LLVAVVLIAAVMATYSAIRYSPLQDQPQVLSALDEINMALRQVLGFTVGYYGSVLQVTGNSTYAKTLASNYLLSGLENIGDIRPEWGPSFNVTTLDLRTSWFTNASYSSGNLSVKYDLTGLGVYGMTYLTSSRLDVRILQSPSSSQAYLSVSKDENEPLINLGKQNLKFYRYLYSDSTWELTTSSSDPSAYANGTYVVDIPSGVDSSSYFIKIEDSRGIVVVASSFSRYASALSWNTTSVEQGFYYVDNNTSDVDGSLDKGTQSNFTAQQYGPDGIYDTLTEGASGTVPQHSFPYPDGSWNALGSTTYVSGFLSDLSADDSNYMRLRSYASATSPQTLYAHQETTTINGDNSYRTLKLTSADATGTTRDRPADSNGRVLMRRFVYPLTGVSTIPASTWTIYYRASRDSGVTAHCDVDILIRRSGGQVRGSIIASDVANSANIPSTSFSTLSGTYSWSSYTVVDQTDYLEIDYYIHVTTSSSGRSVHLRYDDNTLALADQTQVTNVNLPSQYTCAAEFIGKSNTPAPWNDLIWTIVSSATDSGVSVSFQLYNYPTGYPTSGDGFITDTVGTSELTKTQTITTNPTGYKDGSGYWKLKVTAVKSTSAQFDVNLDLMRYSPEVPNYALDLEEQWTNVNATNPRQDLCIKTGALSVSESLVVDVRTGSSWTTVINSLQPNTWNNVSVASYINSATFTIRFRGTTDASDPVQDNWNIDTVFLKNQPDVGFLLSLQDSTTVVECLQNGTLRWIGQNLQLTTQAMPIPPLSVGAIHLNQTINGVNQEVPFQIEDWASEYRIPLGLTNNATVFSNRQMLVFLINNQVTKFTIWWDGSDTAVQTSFAYTNRYFTDNPAGGTLNNGKLNLQFGGFTVTSTVVSTTTSSTANFMRINNEASVYGAGLAYVIYNGPVRDIVQQEAEWGTDDGGGGAYGCPNLYANIVITLPANVTYFTYQLRLMFINSTQPRTITDLCPIELTTTLSSLQAMTENGTSGGFSLVTNGTGTFYNFSSGSWTAHHWSQLVSGTKGTGIMFTDSANQKLYAFDAIAGSAVGAVKADNSTKTIEILPVARSSASFTYPLDITWNGAVATFDNTTPICAMQGSTPTGLWILAEYLPTVTVVAES